MARIYILEGGEWETPPSEEQREYMLQLQDSAREFRGRSRPLLDFLKKSVQYGRKVDHQWLEEMKALMCKRVNLPQTAPYHEVMNALLNDALKGYAGLLELAAKVDKKDEYPEGLVLNCFKRRLRGFCGAISQRTVSTYQDIELKEHDFEIDSSTGRINWIIPTKKIVYDNPVVVVIKNRTFCFTGKFKFGSRKKCAEAVMQRGGFFSKGMSAAVNYLVVSSDEENASSYSSKVESFNRVRFNGTPSQIITEEKWELFL
jgi:NAD-dependent DNA ligase